MKKNLKIVGVIFGCLLILAILTVIIVCLTKDSDNTIDSSENEVSFSSFTDLKFETNSSVKVAGNDLLNLKSFFQDAICSNESLQMKITLNENNHLKCEVINITLPNESKSKILASNMSHFIIAGVNYIGKIQAESNVDPNIFTENLIKNITKKIDLSKHKSKIISSNLSEIVNKLKPNVGGMSRILISSISTSRISRKTTIMSSSTKITTSFKNQNNTKTTHMLIKNTTHVTLLTVSTPNHDHLTSSHKTSITKASSNTTYITIHNNISTFSPNKTITTVHNNISTFSPNKTITTVNYNVSTFSPNKTITTVHNNISTFSPNKTITTSPTSIFYTNNTTPHIKNTTLLTSFMTITTNTTYHLSNNGTSVTPIKNITSTVHLNSTTTTTTFKKLSTIN